MADVKLIVAFDYQGAQEARKNLGLDPRQVKLISTSNRDSASLGRGMMLDKDQVVWVPGWTEGKHAREIEDALRICMVKGGGDG